MTSGIENGGNESFRRFLYEQGRQPSTIASYVAEVEKFSGRGTFSSRDDILSHKQHLLDQGRKAATINKFLNAMTAYNDFLMAQGKLDRRWIYWSDRIKVAQGSHQVDVLTEEEFRRVQQVLPSLSYRNQSLIHLLLYAGLRASELVELRMGQIDLIGRNIEVHGKGDKVRKVPLREDTLERIREYIEKERIEHRLADTSPFVFLSQRGVSLTGGGLADILSTLDEVVGRHLYPHLFRHTFATRLTQKHIDITIISRLLEHHSIERTNRYYIQTLKEENHKAIEQL
ncbi:tyrosine-type recombinase/integrase [Exiguobacterium sp. LL15]|uniref:tyrosine-type recombinase/integrase n=1 Tax=Exiguobacterium sp. LL15 TaxID=2950547 RepID=UPI002109BABA|nr:tyrosine-type recombinase/integrase [Exiguobacterium sp. LL15]MCQ4089129.1 tyrosine-type recombinase/integrase [Exiguobacterium sp. LL15]